MMIFGMWATPKDAPKGFLHNFIFILLTFWHDTSSRPSFRHHSYRQNLARIMLGWLASHVNRLFPDLYDVVQMAQAPLIWDGARWEIWGCSSTRAYSPSASLQASYSLLFRAGHVRRVLALATKSPQYLAAIARVDVYSRASPIIS
jgi:hypothetical protein